MSADDKDSEPGFFDFDIPGLANGPFDDEPGSGREALVVAAIFVLGVLAWLFFG